MADEPFLTEYEWKPAMVFVFATLKRHLTGAEAEKLCEKYADKHNPTTVDPGNDLFVDLRPALSVPLSEIEPKTFASVPKGYARRIP